MEIGKRLKVLRKESGETQTQVAAAIGIVMRHYQRIENDEGVVGPKGWAVRPLKRYASWVQNVVRQFGPYPARA